MGGFLRKRGFRQSWLAAFSLRGNLLLQGNSLLELDISHTICPETITEIVCFQFPRCKSYIAALEIDSPTGPVRQKLQYGNHSDPYKNYAIITAPISMGD